MVALPTVRAGLCDRCPRQHASFRAFTLPGARQTSDLAKLKFKMTGSTSSSRRTSHRASAPVRLARSREKPLYRENFLSPTRSSGDPLAPAGRKADWRPSQT